MVSKQITFIESIIKMPSMYYIAKVEDAYLFLEGYEFGLNDSVFSEFMFGFNSFVKEEFNSELDNSWVRLIRYYSGGDVHSLKLFCDIMNKYILKMVES